MCASEEAIEFLAGKIVRERDKRYTEVERKDSLGELS